MTEKKSWQERFKDVFGKKSEDSEVREVKMHEFGVSVVNDQKLEHRMAMLMKLEEEMRKPLKTDDLLKYVAELKDRLDTINHAIYEIAAPYARAGTIPRFSKMMSGWTEWYGLASSVILGVEDAITKEATATSNKDESDKSSDNTFSLLDKGTMDLRMLVRFLHDFLVKHVFKDAFKVLSFCFLDKDVSERAATVIQSVQSQRQREDMTSGSDFG